MGFATSHRMKHFKIFCFKLSSGGFIRSAYLWFGPWSDCNIRDARRPPRTSAHGRHRLTLLLSGHAETDGVPFQQLSHIVMVTEDFSVFKGRSWTFSHQMEFTDWRRDEFTNKNGNFTSYDWRKCRYLTSRDLNWKSQTSRGWSTDTVCPSDSEMACYWWLIDEFSRP